MDRCTQMYSFEPNSGVLAVVGAKPHLKPGDLGYWDSGASLTGTSAGESSELSTIDALPFTARDAAGDYMELRRGSATGEVSVDHNGDELTLLPGQEWRRQSVRTWGRAPGCVITTTYRVTNFGYQDRSKIVYEDQRQPDPLTPGNK